MSKLWLLAFFAALALSWSILSVLAAPLDNHGDQGTAAHKLAPIFHESFNHDEDVKQPAMLNSIVDDKREWVDHEMDPNFITESFDTAAHIKVPEWILIANENAYQDLIVEGKPISRDCMNMFDYLLLGAQIKMNSILEPYLTTDTLNNTKRKNEQLDIVVGSSWQPGESLGANINKYAPDNFSNDEIMQLFEMSDKVRRQLASDAATNEGTLSMAEQKAINKRVFDAYLEAMAGFKVPVNCQQATDDEECPICRDLLNSEQSFELPCTHRYHVECALAWTNTPRSGPINVATQHKCQSCPTCMTGFRLPYSRTK